MSLQNSVVVITGAAGGIGSAIAHRFGREGARLALCDRNEPGLRHAVESMKREEFTVLEDHCDIGDKALATRFIDGVLEKWNRIDVLVNNAGISRPNPLDAGHEELWEQILRTNLSAAYYCTVGALRGMPRGGRIVNISSVLGKIGESGFSAYCASKHGIIGLTRALALEVAPRRITVNAVCPGWVDTAMAHQDLEEAARRAGFSYQEARQRALNQIPLQQIIQPQEVAELVWFLASPAGENMTGQAVNICGGLVMY
ncbi:MAG: SDR family NAD(P)-dependent oxidoreductase [Acidobacteriota bacterium]